MSQISNTQDNGDVLPATITFIINQIFAEAPDDYPAKLLSIAGIPENSSLSSSVNTVISNTDMPQLTTAASLQLTDAQQKLANIKIACALEDINAQFPLQPGEIIQPGCDGALLAADWKRFTKGTPVMTRITNYSTIYALYTDLVFSGNMLQKAVTTASPVLKSSNPCWGWDLPVSNDPSTAYLLDALTVVEAIPEVGALLTPFISMFTTAETSTLNWDDVFNMAYCAAEQISKENDVSVLKGQMSAMNNTITISYAPAKQQILNATSAEDRSSKMDHANTIGSPIVTNLIGYLGGLSADDLGAPALVAYTTGASTIVGMYQDLSTVDSSVSDPSQSTYIGSMKSYAAESAEYIQSTVAQLIVERQQAVSLVLETVNKEVCTGGPNQHDCSPDGTVTVGAHWYDAITGKTSKSYKVSSKHSSSKDVDKKIQECTDDMNQYIAGLVSTLNQQFAPLLAVATSLLNATVPYALPSSITS